MPKPAEKQTKDWRSLRICILVTGSIRGMWVVVVVFDLFQRLTGDVSQCPQMEIILHTVSGCTWKCILFSRNIRHVSAKASLHLSFLLRGLH